MLKSYDVIIVGASFAGLSTAIAAAQRGLRVLVLERRAQPDHGIRTTGILVKEVFDHFTVPGALLRKIDSVRLYAPSMRHMDLKSSDYFFCTTDTPGLMRHMYQEAEKDGVEIKSDYHFTFAAADDIGVLIPDLNVRGKFLIGADGARSRVAECFGFPAPQEFLIGVEYEYDTSLIDTDRFHCFLDQDLAHGYLGWVAPGVGIIQAGLAVRSPGKPEMKKLLDKIQPIFDCKDFPIRANRGGLIPIDKPFRNFYQDRVILIGDSMSLVSPLTAGGIDYALRYGGILGGYIADYLQDGFSHPGARLARVLPSFRQKHILRAIYDRTPNWALELALHNPLFRALGQKVFFSEKEVRQ